MMRVNAGICGAVLRTGLLGLAVGLWGCSDPVAPHLEGRYELVDVDEAPLPRPGTRGSDRPGVLLNASLVIDGDRFEQIHRYGYDATGTGETELVTLQGDLVLDEHGRARLREDACHPDVFSLCIAPPIVQVHGEFLIVHRVRPDDDPEEFEVWRYRTN